MRDNNFDLIDVNIYVCQMVSKNRQNVAKSKRFCYTHACGGDTLFSDAIQRDLN